MKVTKEQIFDVIVDYNAREKANRFIYDLVLDALKKYEGKQVTKRLANHISELDWIKEKKLRVFYKSEKLWGKELKIYNPQDSYTHRIEWRLDIGANVFSQEHYAKTNICYGDAATERIRLNEIALQDTNRLEALADTINRYKDSVADLKRLNDKLEIPASFSIRKLYEGVAL